MRFTKSNDSIIQSFIVRKSASSKANDKRPLVIYLCLPISLLRDRENAEPVRAAKGAVISRIFFFLHETEWSFFYPDSKFAQIVQGLCWILAVKCMKISLKNFKKSKKFLKILRKSTKAENFNICKQNYTTNWRRSFALKTSRFSNYK